MTHPDPDKQRLDELVTAHAVESLMRTVPATGVGTATPPVILLLTMWGAVNDDLLVIWCIAALALVAYRLWLAASYRRNKPDPSQAARWGWHFTYTSAVNGLLYAVAMFQFFVPHSTGHQVLMMVIVYGLSSASIIFTAYWLWGYYAFAVPALGAAVVRLFMEGTPAHYGLAALTFFYLIYITKIAIDQHRSTYEAIRLRFENLDLVEALRRQKQTAEDANVAKSKFLAAASHDLRQPLHALGLFIAELRERSVDPNTGMVVEKLGLALESLNTLLNTLLDISKLDAGVVKPAVSDFSLADLVGRLAAEYGPQARAKGLEFHANVGDDLVARSDPALLETVLRNLISNAIRYTPLGNIQVNAAAHGETLVIDVADTGIGIPAQYQQEVFREFFQLQNAARDRGKGLGLGLAIVSRLVKLLGHQIEVQSLPGSGSNFRLLVARGKAALLRSPPPLLRPLAALDGAGTFVVVIDDEPLIRERMQSLLTQWGYAAASVPSAEAALESIRAEGRLPAVVIADYWLTEGKTGLEAVRQIWREFGEGITAMIVTGDTTPERLREVQSSGITLLHKPLEPAKLRTALRRVQLRAQEQALPGG